MFYNRISTNNDVNGKVHYVGADEEYFHCTYNIIISKKKNKHDLINEILAFNKNI